MSAALACFLLLSANDPWAPAAGSMDLVTTYSFSQKSIGDAGDAQIATVGADLNIRTFSSWHNGVSVAEYDSTHLSGPRAGGVRPTGGLTATVFFRSEAPSDSAFHEWVSRDANGDSVPHDEIVPDAFRGNLACPGFREHVLRIARTQIDFGTDGIFFDEVDGGYNGGLQWSYNGNEGYDDYHLKEFNQWLVNRYPSYGKAEFVSAFKMDPANALDPTKPLDDLVGNFNYRNYLRTKGWNTYPGISRNPLAALYGQPKGNRMTLHATNFLDSSNTAHWREIVAATRQYARSLGREVLVTSNGIEPFVDFNSFGLYDYNSDGPTGDAIAYVPLTGARLDGSVSLFPVFQSLRQRSEAVSGSAPLTVFLDWPTATMDSYYALPPSQKMDYWRLYGAEAYAAGISFAFHLRTAMPDDPTATQSGILDSIRRTVAFYKRNAKLFHGLRWGSAPPVSPDPQVALSLAWQPSSQSRIVHVVNHHYADGIQPVKGLVIEVPTDSLPESVLMVSQDLDSPARQVPFVREAGLLRMTLDSLYSSAILVIQGAGPDGLRASGRRPDERLRASRLGASWSLDWPGHPGAELVVRAADGTALARPRLDAGSRVLWRPRSGGLCFATAPGAASIPLVALP